MRRFLTQTDYIFFCYYYKLWHKLCVAFFIKDPGSAHCSYILVSITYHRNKCGYFFTLHVRCIFPLGSFILDSLIGATSILYEYLMYAVFVDFDNRGKRKINIHGVARLYHVRKCVANIVQEVFVRTNLIKNLFDLDLGKRVHIDTDSPKTRSACVSVNAFVCTR